jgi:hypothetical protein
MTINDIKTSVTELLATLSIYLDNLKSVSGLINVNDPPSALTSALNRLHVEINEDHDTLDFSKFAIANVFTAEVAESRLQPSNHKNNFVLIYFPGAAIVQFEETLFTLGEVEQSIFDGIENQLSYYKFYNTLKSSDFADHHNDAEKEIILYNSAKGILKIKYPIPAPTFKYQIKHSVEHILSALTNEILRIYLKNSLFEFATGNILTVEYFISKEVDIVSAAKRDQELATKQFDFEKFRDSLYNQKDKFFNAIRDLLSKIYSQIIGIPISITASIFAAYKIEHDRLVSTLILISFLLYVVIYLVTQHTYYKDLQEVKSDFERDFSDINLKSGLPADVVKIEYDKVNSKINTAKNISLVLIFSIVALGVCVVFFVVNQMLH